MKKLVTLMITILMILIVLTGCPRWRGHDRGHDREHDRGGDHRR